MSISPLIHYCWFGDGPKPDIFDKCIASWRKFAPDFEIKEWNEGNFDVAKYEFSKAAFVKRRFEAVSDLVRTKVLKDHGGVYFDTDFELSTSLSEYCENDGFMVLEKPGLVSTAIWGSASGHSIINSIFDYYANASFDDFLPNTKVVSEILINDFDFDLDSNLFAVTRHNFTVYSEELLDLPTSPVIGTHHFDGSWVAQRSRDNYVDSLRFARNVKKTLIIESVEQIKIIVKEFMRIDGKFRLSILLLKFPFLVLMEKFRKQLERIEN